MAAPTLAFRWLEMLEKEFDKAFVDLDILLGEVDEDMSELTYYGRMKLTSMSAAFAQLSQKAQAIFHNNSKLESQLVDLRTELCEVRANKSILEKELQKLLLQLHSAQLQVFTSQSFNSNHIIDSESIKKKLELEMERYRSDALREALLESEVVVLKNENSKLRQDFLAVQHELYGAKLAARYLDKELAGRIQQIQLLGRDMKGAEHDKLWNQLEAEIHLHRHKTVIRACRKRNQDDNIPVPPGHDPSDLRRRQGVGEIRYVTITKEDGEGLGISVTGGREHGVPILVSEIRSGMAAEKSGTIFVGDAILSVNGIDLRDKKHKEAVDIIVEQREVVNLELLFVSPESDSEDDEKCSYQPSIPGLDQSDTERVANESEIDDLGEAKVNDEIPTDGQETESEEEEEKMTESKTEENTEENIA
ncbi:hypothetical protein CHUAL_012042 [Chamberlinius hualienensis]